MKKITFLATILIFSLYIHAQNVGIGTTTPQAKLEVKNPVKAAIRVSSNNYLDTTQLIFSNRNDLNEGTDMNVSFNQENDLIFHTTSDLPGLINDSILYLRTNGRIGVATTSPTEALDVNGNVNVRGTIKANGVDGSAGQVLMQNNSGNLSWGDMSQYNNMVGFAQPSWTTSNLSLNWVVPAGVTKIYIELWGAGGGGAVGGGGGGGGYTATEWTVTPSTSVSITLGGVGTGAPSSVTNGTNGNETRVQINSAWIEAGGGGGATTTRGGSPGGFSTNFGTIRPIGQSGTAGEASIETYGQYNSSIFYSATRFGSGGNAGNTNYTSKNGGFRSINNGNSVILENILPQIGTNPGGGGGGHPVNSSFGGPGQVIIRY